MKSKILFLCNTPYQLLTAINIRIREFSRSDADLIITDHIGEFEKLISGCRNSKLFKNCYIMNVKKYNWKNYKYFLSLNYHHNLLKELLPYKNFCIDKNVYSHYLFSNIGGVAPILGNYLRIRNKFMKFELFEDGFSTYTSSWLKHIKNKKLFNIFVKTSVGLVNRLFVYNPELMSKNSHLKIKKLKKIDETLLKILNIVFDFGQCCDKYKEKYIFFEECFFTDGRNIDDCNIINSLSGFIDKNQLIIKVHPRNPVNRFVKMGYKTNQDTFIPWEVIALNIDLSEKIMITISSSSPITASYNINKKAKANILLYDMDVFDKSQLSDAIPMFDKIIKGQKDFYLPKNLNDLKDILRNVK